jgi:septal ring-binding cell division protein DamX
MAKGPRPTVRLIDRVVRLVAWLATCGLVYIFGYYVGKGTPDRHATMEERSVRLPVTSTPPAEGQRPKEAKDFPSFYQALPAGERPIDVARGAPVTAPPANPPPSPARPTTTLPPSPPPTARPAATTSTTLVRTTPPSTTPPRPTPTTTQTSLPRLGSTVAAPPATPPTTIPRTSARGSFTVEASPTRSRSEAEQLLDTLRRRGYDATLVQVERDGDTWYRLRVGRYATSAQATDAMRRLRDVEGVTHVFVAAE